MAPPPVTSTPPPIVIDDQAAQEAQEFTDSLDFSLTEDTRAKQDLRAKKADLQGFLGGFRFGSAHHDLSHAATNVLAQSTFSKMVAQDSQARLSRQFAELDTALLSANIDSTPFESPVNPWIATQHYQYMAHARVLAQSLQWGEDLLHIGGQGLHMLSTAVMHGTFNDLGIPITSERIDEMQREVSQSIGAAVNDALEPVVEGVTELWHEARAHLPHSRERIDPAETLEHLYGIPRSMTEQANRDVAYSARTLGTAYAGNLAFGLVYRLGSWGIGGARSFLRPTFMPPNDFISLGEINAWTQAAPVPHFPPPIQKFVDVFHNRLGTMAAEHTPVRMYDAIDHSLRGMAREIPDFSYLNRPRHEIWDAALREHLHQRLPLPKVKFLRTDSRPVAHLTYEGESYIFKERQGLKEIANEIISNDFQHSLKLEYTSFPKIVVAGQHRGQFFFGRTFIEGKTYTNHIRDIGSFAHGAERAQMLQDLTQGTLHAGKAMGEYQSKGLNPLSPHYEPHVLFHIQDVKGRMNELNLPQINPHHLDRLGRLCDEFQQNPGPLTYGYSDVDAAQFIWNRQNRVFAHVDAGLTSTTFSTARNPLILPASEFNAFLRSLEIEGRIHGLRPHEIIQLQESFRMGYQALYTGARSQAAERFFEIDYLVKTIRSEMHRHPESIGVPDSYLNKLIQDLQNKLAS